MFNLSQFDTLFLKNYINKNRESSVGGLNMDVKKIIDVANEKNNEIRNADEKKRQEMGELIVKELSEFIGLIDVEALSEFLAGEPRYLCSCIKLPGGETKGSRWGKVYTNLLNETLEQVNNDDKACYSIIIEDSKHTIAQIIESDRFYDKGYNLSDTFVVYLARKEQQ